MKLILKMVITICFSYLINVEVLAKSITVLDFAKAPFNGEVSQKEIQKLEFKGGIRATLAVPTYLSFWVSDKLVSGIAVKGTEVILLPNSQNDYYTVLPIIGGLNVSRDHKMSDYHSAPRIQLIWYLRNGEYDAIYSLISV